MHRHVAPAVLMILAACGGKDRPRVLDTGVPRSAPAMGSADDSHADVADNGHAASDADAAADAGHAGDDCEALAACCTTFALDDPSVTTCDYVTQAKNLRQCHATLVVYRMSGACE